MITQKDKERIMSQNEVLELLTKHARGLTEEECLNVVGVGDHCSEVVKTNKKISAKDQIKALELIAKRFLDKEKLKIQKDQFDHNKFIDKKKLELEEKKINTEDEQNKNLDTIKEFLNSTKINKEELEVLFDEE